LPKFIEARKQNFASLKARLADVADLFVLPKATSESDPAWFGFPMLVNQSAPFSRKQLVEYLDAKKIHSRQVFAGNLVRQPAYRDVKTRVVGGLNNSDHVMNQAFWIGIYPGISAEMIDYVVKVLHEAPVACTAIPAL
jgi:CDP-6-deoxy-D-xylo-4-hexulose-3-dehydrase